MSDLIFHLCRTADWQKGVDSGEYAGTANDAKDGFIHCSAMDMVAESAAKYHAGADDLILLSIDPHQVNGEVKWEVSRHGIEFPHIYGTVPLTAVVGMDRIPLDNGQHVFPSAFDLSDPTAGLILPDQNF